MKSKEIFDYDEKISKKNRQNNQKSEKNRMVMDGRATRDLLPKLKQERDKKLLENTLKKRSTK